MSSNNWRESINSPFTKGKSGAWISGSSLLRWFYGILVISCFILLMYLVQFSTENLVGTDGYYHIKFASIMRLEGLKPEFPWLPLTILNPGEFADHHFLFHVFLIPFTFGNLIQGAKLASVLFASLAFMSIWWLLRNQKVSYAATWALGLLAISEAFLYRMSMPRVQSLSLAILVLGLNFLLIRKYIFLIPLSFIYVWMYDAFPLLVVLTLLYILAIWIIERRLVLQPLFYVLFGISLGLLINPYFPHNIVFFLRHLSPKLIGSDAVRVGNEWYPYETSQLLKNSPLTLIFFLSGVVALGLSNRRMDSRTATALFLAIFFGLLLFQARRFIEYFPPFVLIFAAFAWDPVLTSVNNKKLGSSTDNLSPPVSDRNKLIDATLKRSWLVGAMLAAIMLAGIWRTTRDAQQTIMESTPTNRYSRASEWLKANTPQSTRIFQTDWDDFPRLFFHNTHNTYLIGLDPTYLYLKEPALYDLWVEITQGKEANPSGAIFNIFAAEYAFTDTSHDSFIDQAQKDPGLEEVYKDEEAIIFRVAHIEQ